MNEATWAAKLAEYNTRNALEQENALQELLQLFALASLSRAKFFNVAAFHGGTCLRILHGTSRFSEDLDFVLKAPDRTFDWRHYAKTLREDWQAEGIALEFQDRSQADAAVQKAFLKTDSIGKVVLLRLPYARDQRKKLRIKLEIDIKPPEGAIFETGFITFPYPVAITKQTMQSSFASKSHALLCRTYTKGRDWYDFLWYADRGTDINYELLGNAVAQQGPWAGLQLNVDLAWYETKMSAKIREIDWPDAVSDVRRFLPQSEWRGLDVWQTDLFLSVLESWAKQKRAQRSARSSSNSK